MLCTNTSLTHHRPRCSASLLLLHEALGEALGQVGTKGMGEVGWVQGAGSEAVLGRVVLEGVGAAARSLGRALREPGTPLSLTPLCLVLLPVLDRCGGAAPWQTPVPVCPVLTALLSDNSCK